VYTTFKFIHVMAAIVWMGSAFALSLVSIGMLRARDYAGATALSLQTNSLGKRVFGPAAATTLLAGIAMVLVSDLSFGDTWIVIGLGGVALSVVFGAVLAERAARDLSAALPSAPEAAVGTDHDTIARLRQRLALLATIDLTVLTVVVWAMVTKP
jgi:uncharacterized membrane protein